MLEYREIDYSKDIPEIVDLLRTSLSETNDVEHFIWKHYKNPFGMSYGLLACDNEKIVGVRMFMFWEFRKGEKVVKAIRPVDTITHPAYRGKDIFKKLTLNGLDYCTKRYDIVFNTPNNNSLPGYLKMGWEKNPTELPFNLGLVFSLSSSKGVRIERVYSEDISLSDLDLDFTCWRTHITQEFIKWRYAAPIYEKASFNNNGSSGYLIYKVKRIKGLKVLILIEYLGRLAYCDEIIKALAFKHKLFLVYYLNSGAISFNPLISFKRKKSLVVYREDPALIISKVNFSTGDLEGRL